METLDWIVLFAYFAILAYLIIRVRVAKRISDFAVANRSIPSILVASTLAGSFLGPGYSMGLSAKAFDNGFVFFFLFLGFSLQTVLIGIWVAPKIQQYKNVSTVGGIVGIHYGKTAQFLTGILSVLFCAGIVGVVAKASGDIISSYSGLSFIWAVSIGSGLVILYSTVAGIKAVVASDALQFAVLSVGISIMFLLGMKEASMSEIISSLPTEMKSISGNMTTIAFLGVFLSFVLGECLVPPYANRALISRTPIDAKRGFIYSGLFSVVWFFLCTGIGLLGKATLDSTGESVFLDVMNHFLPVGLFGLVVAAVFSIIMSTADSFLNAGAVSFTYDVLGLNDSSGKKRLSLLSTAKLLNLLVGILAVAFAMTIDSLVDALMSLYLLWAPTVVPILLIGLFKKNIAPRSGLAAIIAGGIGTIVWEWVLHNPMNLPSVIPGVLLNQLTFWLVQTLSKKHKHTKNIFKT